ncbi:class I SAM-dependent methyltransferase [Edwardsiella ictaluri]|uniref:class I SAM-dependent methyltransferase n=1 Tax=Edwardsiella ictaluri TaxID=67780 RepID=UPI003A598EF6
MLLTESLKTTADFITQFIRSPRTVGAITPSTSYLCRQMVRSVDWTYSRRVAEFGAGTGVLTRHIQRQMRVDARLDIFETNPHFCQTLRNIADRRATVHCASAEATTQKYDTIFSGLPLLAFPQTLRQTILAQAARALTLDGVFIQFQYSPLLEDSLSAHFLWQRTLVWRNLPPPLSTYAGRANPQGSDEKIKHPLPSRSPRRRGHKDNKYGLPPCPARGQDTKKGLAIWPTPYHLTTFGCSESVVLVQALFNAGCLTSTLTQVVQFSFTNGTTTFHSDAVDNR